MTMRDRASGMASRFGFIQNKVYGRKSQEDQEDQEDQETKKQRKLKENQENYQKAKKVKNRAVTHREKNEMVFVCASSCFIIIIYVSIYIIKENKYKINVRLIRCIKQRGFSESSKN